MREFEENGKPLVTLAQASTFKRDNWSPGDLGRRFAIFTADFGSFSAIPSRCSRRSISRHTSSGRTPAAAHKT